MSYRTEVSAQEVSTSRPVVKTTKALPSKPKSKKCRNAATSLEKIVGPASKSIIHQRPTAQLILLRNQDEIFEMAFTFLKKLEGNLEEHLRLFEALTLAKSSTGSHRKSNTPDSSVLSIKENLAP